MRARHVISENLRTVAASEALLRGDMKELGRLMAEAHHSYSSDFEGSCVEADAMVALAQDLPGLIGARLTGGGFGGCTINLVEQQHAADFAKRSPLAMPPKRHRAGDSHLPCLRWRPAASSNLVERIRLARRRLHCRFTPSAIAIAGDLCPMSHQSHGSFWESGISRVLAFYSVVP